MLYILTILSHHTYIYIVFFAWFWYHPWTYYSYSLVLKWRKFKCNCIYWNGFIIFNVFKREIFTWIGFGWKWFLLRIITTTTNFYFVFHLYCYEIVFDLGKMLSFFSFLFILILSKNIRPFSFTSYDYEMQRFDGTLQTYAFNPINLFQLRSFLVG